jgi:hypothetical protein
MADWISLHGSATGAQWQMICYPMYNLLAPIADVNKGFQWPGA